MSAIGRIVIVLNLLLAAAFMGYAASMLESTNNYKQEIADLKAQTATDIAAKDESISSLEATGKTLNDEKRDFREERDANMNKVDALGVQLKEEKRRADNLSTEMTKVTSAMGDLNGTIRSLTSEKDDAVEARHEAEKAAESSAAAALAAELAKRDADDATASAQAMIEELQMRVASLGQDLSQKDTQLAAISKASGIGLDTVMAQPIVKGAVVSVAADLSPQLVMLNVGSSDGVRRGTVFDIYSGGTYKARVRAEQVEAGICSAVVVRVAEGVSISAGDSASTDF